MADLAKGYKVALATLAETRKEILSLGGSREISLALTKLDEAEHWLEAHMRKI